jgi:hypothetical protein
MFLLPGLVIGSYVSRMSFRDEERLEMIRYLFNRAHPDDGGWGLYVFSPHVDSNHGLMCLDTSRDPRQQWVPRSTMSLFAYWESQPTTRRSSVPALLCIN